MVNLLRPNTCNMNFVASKPLINDHQKFDHQPLLLHQQQNYVHHTLWHLLIRHRLLTGSLSSSLKKRSFDTISDVVILITIMSAFSWSYMLPTAIHPLGNALWDDHRQKTTRASSEPSQYHHYCWHNPRPLNHFHFHVEPFNVLRSVKTNVLLSNLIANWFNYND